MESREFSVRDWVNCPICGESDMRLKRDDEGHPLIFCVNHACGSNGGSNFSAIEEQFMARALTAAQRRAESARDSLAEASKAEVRYISDEAYTTAIDELDKLVYGLRVMSTNKMNRDRWLTKV